MRKLVSALLALTMTLILAAAALADNTLTPFYDAAVELLYETSNVTLTGEAEFTLDGERFKTAEVRYIQDFENSLYQLSLHTPRRDGTEGTDRESGYTIIANGEYVYVMEVIYPGVYKTGTHGSESTVLRDSVQMNLMRELIRMITDQADALLGEDAATVTQRGQGGQELQIKLNEDVPGTVNTLLNVFYQFAAKRYFEVDYDYIREQEMIPMDYYLTVAQGILGTTKSVSLKQADLTLDLDESGRLEQAAGAVSLLLSTGMDGTRHLDITFRADASDRNESHVGKFDPAEYGVRLAEGAMIVYDVPAEDELVPAEEEPAAETEPASESGYQPYEHDPRDNPNAMKDIVYNPEAVYCFSPSPDSTRLKDYVNAIDWTDPEQVADARAVREQYHESMKELYQIITDMLHEGKNVEEIARAVSKRRNEIRLESEKDDPEKLALTKKSNLDTYGNEDGPTPDQLYEKYGSWQKVLEKALGTNAGMDACLGFYDEYYELYDIE